MIPFEWSWLDSLPGREAAEVRFALAYVSQHNHGASGHLAMTTLAKVATIAAELARQADGIDVAGVQSALNKMSVAPSPPR